MAIRLITADYCQDCMSFEADVKKPEKAFIDNGADYIQTDTVIKCQHQNWCEHQVRYLKGRETR